MAAYEQVLGVKKPKVVVKKFPSLADYLRELQRPSVLMERLKSGR